MAQLENLRLHNLTFNRLNVSKLEEGPAVFDLSSIVLGGTQVSLTPIGSYPDAYATAGDMKLAGESPAPVPEPGSMLLLTTGLAAAAAGRLRKRFRRIA
jgi:hypothetical protein